MLYLMAFTATFMMVFLKALQQRNVAFDNYVWVVPISFCLAAAEVYIISRVAMTGWDLPIVASMGFGGGIGALTAMLFHKKFVKDKK